MSSTADKKLHKPLPQLQNAAAVQPYLTAALSVLHTLENELRAAAAPGSREEISADALALRSTELQTQIARLELETRSANLEHQLNESFGNLEKSKDRPLTKGREPPNGKAAAQISELQGKLAVAERDCKAYKARLRHQEEQINRVRELTEREAELESKLITAEGAAATAARETEELRKRALLAEASTDALRAELEVMHGGRAGASKTGDGQAHGELLHQVSELQRKVQSVQLEKATWERKAEICEAELVDALAQVYTLQGGAGGSVARELTEVEESQLEECLHHALETASSLPPHQSASMNAAWNTSAWLESLGLGEAVGMALLRRLRGSGPAERVWLERQFLGALASKGGYPLVRAVLLETNLVDELSTRVWNGLVEMAGGGASMDRLQGATGQVQHYFGGGGSSQGGSPMRGYERSIGGSPMRGFGDTAVFAAMAAEPPPSIKGGAESLKSGTADIADLMQPAPPSGRANAAEKKAAAERAEIDRLRAAREQEERDGQERLARQRRLPPRALENEYVAGGTDRPTYAAKAPMPVQAPSFGQFSDVFPASGAR